MKNVLIKNKDLVLFYLMQFH